MPPVYPVIIMNTDDKASGRDAYVGGDNVAAGHRLAQYLVDHGFVKRAIWSGRQSKSPVRLFRRSKTQGYDTVFKPLGVVTCDITEAKLDQLRSSPVGRTNLTANRSKIKAIIGIGDLVSGSIKRVFDQVGVKAGEIPVVGWGDSADTAQESWMATSVRPCGRIRRRPAIWRLSMAAMAASGIPPGFDVAVGTLYEKEKAAAPTSRSCRAPRPKNINSCEGDSRASRLYNPTEMRRRASYFCGW